MLKMKELSREGGITGLLEFNVIEGYLMEIDDSIEPFDFQ